jgi:hypothetical protein
MRGKISELQGRMGEYLGGVTLAELASSYGASAKETTGGKA